MQAKWRQRGPYIRCGLRVVAAAEAEAEESDVSKDST